MSPEDAVQILAPILKKASGQAEDHMRLSPETALLLVIDVQEKIFATMHEEVETEENINRIVAGAKILKLPIIWTEQYPRGLGPTIASVQELLKDNEKLEKIAFSCLGDAAVKESLRTHNRKQVLVCGIEAHVCVYQTVVDLVEEGYDVHLVTDATMSRKESNYRLAVTKMGRMGAQLTSVEMALFELQRVAKGDTFKAIAGTIK